MPLSITNVIDSQQPLLSRQGITSVIKMPGMEPGDKIREAREQKDWSQKDLADKVGISQVAINKIESGHTTQSKFLPKIAQVLGLDLADLVSSLQSGNIESPVDFSTPLPTAKILMPDRDFPIYSAAEGGPGEIIRSSEPVDWYPRPAQVQHVRDAYGLYVVGESMVLEFEPGDIALVNPILPPMGQKPCIFYTEVHGEARATIKRYVRQTSSHWFLYQHNPPRGGSHEFSLSRKEWRVCHRVLGKYYPQ